MSKSKTCGHKSCNRCDDLESALALIIDYDDSVPFNDGWFAIGGTMAHETAKAAVEEYQGRLTSLEAEVMHWKANHATEVRRARILKERPDMPIERVEAYGKWGEDLATIAKQAQRIAELEKDRDFWKSSHTVDVRTRDATIAAQADQITTLTNEGDSNLRMFQAAILDLASISEKLAVDPDEGGAVPIIEAIDELEATIAAQSADAKRWDAVANLMVIGDVELTQDEDGGYKIYVEPVENFIATAWIGDTPEDVIDKVVELFAESPDQDYAMQPKTDGED